MVSRRQLRALGLSRHEIGDRLDSGLLHPLFRGVYAAGHRKVTKRGWYMAAVLAAGPGAVLSHRSAADHWGLRPDSRTTIDVTTRRRSGDREGLTVHHPKSLVGEDVTTFDGIPVTTAMRTLVDLAGVVNAEHLRRALTRSEQLDLLDLRPLHRLMRPGVPGAASLRGLLTAYDSDANLRSDLERELKRLCKQHRLPRPKCNVLVHGHEVDFFWAEVKLIVEVDGWRYHGTREAFDHDRNRDTELTLLGFTTIRFPDRRIIDEAEIVVRQLRQLSAGGR